MLGNSKLTLLLLLSALLARTQTSSSESSSTGGDAGQDVDRYEKGPSSLAKTFPDASLGFVTPWYDRVWCVCEGWLRHVHVPGDL